MTRRRITWKREQVEYLLACYADYPLDVIADKLGLPEESVVRKAQRLGLSVCRSDRSQSPHPPESGWVTIDWRCRDCQNGHLSGNIPVKDLAFWQGLWEKVHGGHLGIGPGCHVRDHENYGQNHDRS